MKHIATMTLMLTLGVAAVYAQEKPVRMTFSGNSAASPINLNQPNTSTFEENVAGKGTVGSFTFRNVTATAASPSPEPPGACSGPTHLYFPRVAGAGIFRFEDGSLLKVNLTRGGDCIDLVHMKGHCTLILQIMGGTGRFKGAKGVLTYTETAMPVLADASENPVFFTEAGEITGAVSEVSEEQGQDGQ
jgi:hypothetical protein